MIKSVYLLFLGCMVTFGSYSQDLSVTKLRVSQTTVHTNGRLTAQVTLSFSGKPGINGSNTGIFLSSDSVITFDDIYLGQYQNKALNDGMTETTTASLYFKDISKGNYYLIALADFDAKVTEINESNNSLSVPLEITANPDLDINDFTSTYNTHISGGEFSGFLRFKIFEIGAFSSISIGYYLSKDSLIDVTDELISQKHLYNNEFLGDYTFVDFNLPSGISNGEYYIIAHIDNSNFVAEANEVNNYKALKLIVEDEYFDLQVSSYHFIDTTGAYNEVQAGASIRTSSLIFNAGNSDVANVSVGYYLSKDSSLDVSDAWIQTNFVGEMFRNNPDYDYLALNIADTTTPGTYYVIAVADANHFYQEVNETNNTKSLKITVKEPSIDLSINFLSSGDTTFIGSYINALGAFYNNGSLIAEPSTIHYYLSDDTIYNEKDIFLGSEKSYHVQPMQYTNFGSHLSLPDSIKEGDYYLLAIADALNDIQETDENNNLGFAKLNVGNSFIDIYSTLKISSDTIVAGHSIFPQNRIFNIGSSESKGQNSAYYFSTDTILDDSDALTNFNYFYSSRIPANSYYDEYPTIELPGNYKPGKYYLIVNNDVMNDNVESDENNNVSYTSFYVKESKGDLTVHYISDSLEAYLNTYVYPTISIENKDIISSGNFRVGYYLSKDQILDNTDTLLLVENISSLPGLSTQNFQHKLEIGYDLHPGNYYMLCVADAFNEQLETDENNNIAILKTTIKSNESDLKISGQFEELTVLPGTLITPSYFNYNTGGGFAAQHAIGYYVSNDSILDPKDIFLFEEYVWSGVSPGEYSIQNPSLFMPDVATGTYYLIAFTDRYNEIIESNELNNLHISKLNIGINGVDLTISNFNSSNNNPYPGTTFYPEVIVANSGNVSAGNHFVGYFLSSDMEYSTDDLYLSTNFIAGLNGDKNITLNPSLYIPASVSYGSYYLLAIADYGSKVEETIEYNNTFALPVTVGQILPQGIDLALTYLYMDAAVKPESYLGVWFQENNLGNDLSDYHRIGFVLTRDSLEGNESYNLGTYDISYLGGNSNLSNYISLYIPENVRLGQYNLKVYADYDNFITETNEYNNIATHPVSVTSVTGINNNVDINTEISIYPNPSNGNITFTNLKNVEKIEVSDLNSKILVTKSASALSSGSLDLNHLSAGIYVVKTYKVGNATSTTKLVISK